MGVKVYTSYYANPKLKSLPTYIKTVSVSNSTPAWFEPTFNLERLSPSWALIEAYKQRHISFELFREKYCEELMRKFESAEEIRNLVFNRIGPDDVAVLLCWEKNESICHRSILAEFFPDEYVGEL